MEHAGLSLPAIFGGAAFVAAALAGLSFVVPTRPGGAGAAGTGYITRGTITPKG